MSTYVLVHGAWMGKFAWDKVVPQLQTKGHTVLAVELPAHGDDPTPVIAASLDGYAQAVITAIGTQRDVILVGHSMAGMVISLVAERIPAQLAQLIYVCAYLPRSGDSLYALAQEDTDSKVGQYWHQDDPAHYSPASIRPEGIVEVFGADCNVTDQQLLIDRHQPEPLSPLATPVTLTADNFGRVPRAYIETAHDNCVSHTLQIKMIERVGVDQRVLLASSHSPFLAMPAQLVAALIELNQ